MELLYSEEKQERVFLRMFPINVRVPASRTMRSDLFEATMKIKRQQVVQQSQTCPKARQLQADSLHMANATFQRRATKEIKKIIGKLKELVTTFAW